MSPSAAIAGVVVAAFIAAGCAAGSTVALVAPDSAPPFPPTPAAAPTPTATAAPTPTAQPTLSPTPTVPPTPAVLPTPTPEPAWWLEIVPIDATLAVAMTPTSWREGCPVALDALRLLRFPHVDFDGEVRTGELVVGGRHAEDVGWVFEQLFAAGYPIQRIELVDVYGGDDRTSMQANNTSGFNCRPVGTGSGAWSNHAFGEAIDINPLMNPLVRGDFVDPPEGGEFLDRDDVRLGMIVADDAAVRAFAEIGWVWGGTWRSLKDYQHFSDDGR